MFTSGKEIKQAAGNAGIGLTYANETPFFHFADYRTAASNDLPGAPAAKTISITHSESYRTRLTYNSWGRSYKLEMYNRSKKAYENTVDELTGKQLTFDNVVVCFADIAAYAGDSHDVQSVNYVAGGMRLLPAAHLHAAPCEEIRLPTGHIVDPEPGQDLSGTGGQ